MISRAMRISLALLLSGFLMVVVAPNAFAESATIKGVVLDSAKAPLAGVELTVRDDAATLATVTTDATGSWSYVATKTGNYYVKINLATLPDGQTLTEGIPEERRVNVLQLRGSLSVLFPIGEGAPPSSTFDQTMQLLVDGAILGLIIALAALGLNLVYGTTGLTNFAHGELLTLGGLFTYFFSAVVGLRVFYAIPLALIASAIIGGYLQDRFLWKPLRRRGTGLIAMLVVSIGFAIFVRYFFLFIFGGSRRLFDRGIWWVILSFLSSFRIFGGLRASGGSSWFLGFLLSSRQFCLFCFRRTPGLLLWRFWFSNWFNRCGLSAAHALMPCMDAWSSVNSPWSTSQRPIERYGWPLVSP